jgi:hypothetical protein
MPNYKEGLNRIQAAPNINFNGVISTANGMPENADVDKVINDFRKTIINEYKDDDDWKETCNNYFKGGKDSDKDYSANEISIRELANQVLNIPKIVDNIKKDKSTSDQLFKSLESAINKAASQQPAASTTNTDSANTGSNTPATPAASPAGNPTESTYLYGDVFSEIEINKTNAPAAGATGSNSASITTSGNQTIDNVKNGGVDSKTAVNAQKIVNRIASTYSTYMQCKYQMAEKIMSDYMKIIKAHVSAYVNANNDSEKAQQAN